MGHDLGTAFSAELGADGAVAVVGDLDVVAAPEFDAALRSAANATTGDLVVDFAQVTFLDSAGMNALVRVFKLLDPQQRRLVLRNPNNSVRRALEVGGAGAFADLR